MKEFETCDLFKALRLIKNSGIKEQIEPLLTKVAKGEKDVEKVGVEAITTVFFAFAEKGEEAQLMDLLSNPLEMTPEEVSHLTATELTDSIEKLWTDYNLKVFFERLFKQITTK